MHCISNQPIKIYTLDYKHRKYFCIQHIDYTVRYFIVAFESVPLVIIKEGNNNECWTIDKSAVRKQFKDIKLNKPRKIGSYLFEMCFKTQQKQNEVFYECLLIENLHTINELCPILFW